MKTKKMTGAQILVETLEQQGVELIFGYPGGATLPIYDVLAATSIKHILVRHEQGAAHMADGFARKTGKVGVCMATSGPGATNLVTGIATAFMDSTPMIVLTGQVPQSVIGNDAFQEVDITGITLPITKHNYLIQSVDEIRPVIEQAFYLASSGRPGPVLIDIPKNILTAEAHAVSSINLTLEGYNPTTKGHPGQIKRAVKLLNKAERPVIIAGGGARHCDKLLEISLKGDIPVVTSLMGKSAFPNNDAHYFGLYGYHGRVAANTAVSQADVILSVGTRFGDRSTGPTESFAPDALIIHIDIDPAEISKNIPSFLPIVGEAGQVVTEIAQQMPRKSRTSWLEKLQTVRLENPLPPAQQDFSVPNILRTVERTAGETTVVTDVGRHQIFAAHYMTSSPENPFITSGGMGTMGFGLPAAIGAAFGTPGKRIILITGDGSFLMNCQEITTAAENRIPITVLVMNDMELGMIHQLQDAFYDHRYESCKFSQAVDFAALARSMGAGGSTASSLEEVEAVMKKTLEWEGPYIIDCRILKGENVLPMVTGSSLTSFMSE